MCRPLPNTKSHAARSMVRPAARGVSCKLTVNADLSDWQPSAMNCPGLKHD